MNEQQFIPQAHFNEILNLENCMCPARKYYDCFGDLSEFESTFLYRELLKNFKIPEFNILSCSDRIFEDANCLRFAAASFSSVTDFVKSSEAYFRMRIKVNTNDSTIVKYLDDLNMDQVLKLNTIWLEEIISIAALSVDLPKAYQRMKIQQEAKAIKWNQYITSLSNMSYWETFNKT